MLFINKVFFTLSVISIISIFLIFWNTTISKESIRKVGVLNYVTFDQKPYVYEDEVDLRIIVLTYKRPKSVKKLLDTIQTLELDGDKAVLEIWIDQNKKGLVDKETLEVATTFEWKKGLTHVNVHASPSGLLGQWIDTWRPRNSPVFQRNYSVIENLPIDNTKYREICLILEDDMSVSPHAYRWVKAAHRKYGHRLDFGGVTLDSDQVKAFGNGHLLKAPRNQSAYMSVGVGSWGFSPSPHYWAMFQNWYHEKRGSQKETKFQPFIPGIKTTVNNWFKLFIKQGTQDSMWTMWFIYFRHLRNIFTVHSNLEYVLKKKRFAVGVNRQEVGLHFPVKGADKDNIILNTWNDTYMDLLPDEPLKFGWNGQKMNDFVDYRLVVNLK